MASITVTFEDGSRQTLAVRPVGLVAAERHWNGKPPNIEGSLYACWYGLTRGQGTPFEEWLDTLADIDTDDVEEPPDPPQAPPPAG